MVADINELRSNAEVTGLIMFGRLPQKDATDQNEKMLYRYLTRKREAGRKGYSNIFYPSDIELLKKAHLWDAVNDFVTIKTPLMKLQTIIEWLQNIDCNDVQFFRKPEFTQNFAWLRYRKSAVIHNPPILEKFCADAGFPGLTTAKLKTDEFRRFVMCVQLVKWHSIHKRMPDIRSSNQSERGFAVLLEEKRHLPSYALDYLKGQSIQIFDPVIEIDEVPTTPVLDFNSLKQEIDNLKSQVQALSDALLSMPKEEKAKKLVSAGIWFKKGYTKRAVCPESELMGMMHYRTSKGKEMILGIENYMKYPTGSIKYAARILNSKNEYRKLIYIWDTSKGILHIELFDEKKTV